MFAEVLRGWMDLVAPPECLGCRVRLPLGVPVGFCTVCEVTLAPLADTPGAFEYGGALVDAIHRFKYEGRPDLAAPLGALFVARTATLKGRADVVIAVPLHRRRRLERGFDQSRLLAKIVARQLGVPRDRRTLRRVRDTETQAELSRTERRLNMVGAFAARPLPEGRRVLLVDDVYTTGATMRAAASALVSAGAAEVRLLALAASL